VTRLQHSEELWAQARRDYEVGNFTMSAIAERYGIKLATVEGRAARKGLKIGICGEHGGDPRSIALCHELGLDYVSCSPFRVPVARLAAAQAALR